MAGISIDFAADTTRFIGATRDIETALEGVSDSLDDLAADAQKAGKEAEDGLDQVGQATKARDGLRTLAAQAREAGSDMEHYFTSAADEIDAELKAMAQEAERHLEDIGDEAKKAGQDLDKGLSEGAEDAQSAAEKLEKTFKETFDTAGKEAKKAGEDIGRDTTRGLKDAEDATETFRDEARQNLAESVSSFRGDIEDIPQLLQDVLGGVSADLGMLGGLAAAGGAAVIGIAIQQLQGLADRINEAKEQTASFAREVVEVGANLDDVDLVGKFRDWAFEIADARNWWEVWQSDAVTSLEHTQRALDITGESFGDFAAAMTSWDAEQATALLKQYQDAQADTANYMGMTSVEAEELSKAYGNLIDPLQKTIKEKEFAAEASLALRAAEEKVSVEVIKTRDALEQQNAVIEENNELKDKAAKLAGDAYLAEGDYAVAVMDATAKIAENKTAIDDANTSEAERTKLLQDNREQLVGIATDGRAYAQTMADAGKSQDQVNTILQRARTDFINAATAAGTGADEANRLADELGLIPNSVQVEIDASTEAAQDKINRFITLNDGRRVRVTVDAVGGKTYRVEGTTTQFYNSGGTVKAAGGLVVGPGTDIEDQVPAMLSPGEGVLRKSTVDALGGPGIIDALNNHQGLPSLAPTPQTPTTARIDRDDLEWLATRIATIIETSPSANIAKALGADVVSTPRRDLARRGA